MSAQRSMRSRGRGKYCRTLGLALLSLTLGYSVLEEGSGPTGKVSAVLVYVAPGRWRHMHFQWKLCVLLLRASEHNFDLETSNLNSCSAERESFLLSTASAILRCPM